MAGRVLDQTGAPLAGVAVELTTGATALSTVTDERGLYKFEPVPAGPAGLTFRLLNFTVVRRVTTVVETARFRRWTRCWPCRSAPTSS